MEPEGLGEEEKPAFRLIREEVERPGTRLELCARFESIVNLGRVQRVEVDLRHPIVYWRLVPANELAEAPPEMVNDDIWGRVRNGTLEEMNPGVTGAPPFGLLFWAFDALTTRGLRPVRVFCKGRQQLNDWLGVSVGSHLFGVPIATHTDVPDDAVILAGESGDELNPTTVGIRVGVDMPETGVKPTVKRNVK